MCLILPYAAGVSCIWMGGLVTVLQSYTAPPCRCPFLRGWARFHLPYGSSSLFLIWCLRRALTLRSPSRSKWSLYMVHTVSDAFQFS